MHAASLKTTQKSPLFAVLCPDARIACRVMHGYAKRILETRDIRAVSKL
jgi:hypothetical protein